MGMGAVGILPVGADSWRCPRPGCGALIGADAPDSRQPLRWFCGNGHSGYFHVPEPMRSGSGIPAPPGAAHGSRRYTRCCSECGEPVRAPARKCADCRSHG